MFGSSIENMGYDQIRQCKYYHVLTFSCLCVNLPNKLSIKVALFLPTRVGIVMHGVRTFLNIVSRKAT